MLISSYFGSIAGGLGQGQPWSDGTFWSDGTGWIE